MANQGQHKSLVSDQKEQKAQAQAPSAWEQIKQMVRNVAHTLGLSQEETQHAMAGATAEATGMGTGTNIQHIVQKNVANVSGLDPQLLAEALNAGRQANSVGMGAHTGNEFSGAQVVGLGQARSGELAYS